MNFLLRRLLNTWPLGGHRAYAGPLEKMVVDRSTWGRRPWYCRPMENPRWRTAERDHHMRPEDTVLGLVLDDEAYALPWWIMKNHHVANLELRGEPILVTLCEACASACAFVPVVGGRRYRFVVEGTYNTTPILTDLETLSLWAMFTGEALHGPLTGATLERRLLHQSTWQDWKEIYPGSRVLDGRGESRRGHGADLPGPGSPVVPPFVDETRLRFDDRLPQTELVLGVEAGRRSRAYPLGWLHRQGAVVEDTVGGEEIVIFTRPGSWMSAAFGRRVDGRRLEFRAAPDFPVEDVETGSRWDIRGHAVAGPLAGRALPFVPSGIEKWYAWSAYHPQTDVHHATS